MEDWGIHIKHRASRQHQREEKAIRATSVSRRRGAGSIVSFGGRQTQAAWCANASRCSVLANERNGNKRSRPALASPAYRAWAYAVSKDLPWRLVNISAEDGMKGKGSYDRNSSRRRNSFANIASNGSSFHLIAHGGDERGMNIWWQRSSYSEWRRKRRKNGVA